MDEERKTVMMEVCSTGYRERYITLFLEDAAEIDRLIESLAEARKVLA